MLSSTLNNGVVAFKVMKVFGYGCFTVENGKCVTKPVDVFFLLLSICTGFVFLFLSIKYQKQLGTTKSDMIRLGNQITYVAAIVMAIISMILVFCNRRRVWSIFLTLYEIEKKFFKIGLNRDHSKIARVFMFSIVFLVILLWPIIIFVHINDGSFLKTGLYIYSGINFALSAGSALGFINGTLIRLESVNKICESMLSTSGDVRKVKERNSKCDKVEIIGTLIEAYGNFVEIYDSINVCYGVPTMMGFGLLFFYSIFANFMAYKNLSTAGYLDPVTISTLLVTIYLHLFTFSIIFICEATEKEGQKILKLVNSIIKHSKDELEVSMLISLNLLIKRNPLKFSCGLFDFDWKMTFAVSMFS